MTWGNEIFPLLIITPTGGFTGLFLYSPGPGAGKLIGSFTAQAGTDPYGNAYLQGLTVYNPPGGTALNIATNSITFYTGPVSGAGPWTLTDSVTASLDEFIISTPNTNLIWMLPSGDTTGAIDTANLEGLAGLVTGGAGAQIMVAPGTYYIKAGQISIDQKTTGPIYIRGAGIELTKFNILGSANGIDGLRWFDSKTGGNAYLPGGGAFTGITLDGTGVSGTGCSLIHLGDMYNFEVDFAVQNLPAASGIGAWFDNQWLFMEQLHGRVHVHQCGNPAVQFDNSTGTAVSAAATGSFDRATLDIMLDQKGRGSCVTFAGGANIADGRLGIYGNTDYGAAAYAVLTLTGSNAGGESRIIQSVLNIGVECNATVGTQPQTINFGTTGPTGNQIFQCDGLIDFSANNLFAVSNNDHSFFFAGPVFGDNQLQSSGTLGDAIFKHGALVNNGTIQTKFFRIVEVTPAANVTGIIMDAFLPDDWRRITVMNNGTGTITFNVAPATSHIAGAPGPVINPNECQDYEYNPDVNLWYPVQ